ncbi:MAG: SH3 domain-containing protein [Clostridia bacterium]|nr:SH3 domain-containing protein [Clostridia bacterium]
MRNGRNLYGFCVAVGTAAALALGAGCSRLQADVGGDLTLADRVTALEQQVAELQLATGAGAAGSSGSGATMGTNGAAKGAGSPETSGYGSAPGGAAGTAGGAAAPTAAGGMTAPTAAGGTTRAVVSADILNVRAEPRPDAVRTNVLKRGALVEVVAVKGDWARIHFQNDRYDFTGWVKNEYLRPQAD